MPLTKATITNISLDGAPPIEVLFNPTDYTITRGANYAEIPAPGLATPILQFVRGEASALKMDLLLDGTDARADVHDRLEALRDLVRIDSELHTPPVVTFSWGRESFQGVITQLVEKMTLFDQNGAVLRSRLTVTFKSYESVDVQSRETARQSPDRTRIHIVREGETLPHIAFHAYGDPTMWRLIAAENDIDRPRFVATGATLRIPSAP